MDATEYRMSWARYFEILGAALLASPLVWEITNDKDGDAHITRAKVFAPYQILSKRIDVYVRVALIAVAAGFNYWVNGVSVSRSVALALAIHFMFFDYGIAFVLIKRKIIVGHWFTYLGSKGMDNISAWRRMDPRLRLLARVLVFTGALTFYFL